MKIKLIVFTPDGKKYDDEVDFVQIHGSNNFLGILPNHTPLISDVIVSKMIIRKDGIDSFAAVSKGVVSIDNNVVKVVVDAFEMKEDIDIERAKESKSRAEERLENPSSDIEIIRAKASLSRALNRLSVAGEI